MFPRNIFDWHDVPTRHVYFFGHLVLSILDLNLFLLRRLSMTLDFEYPSYILHFAYITYKNPFRMALMTAYFSSVPRLVGSVSISMWMHGMASFSVIKDGFCIPKRRHLQEVSIKSSSLYIVDLFYYNLMPFSRSSAYHECEILTYFKSFW